MTDDRPDYTGSIVIEDIENVTAVITVTGAVTVSGNITITNSTIAVTQSGSWNIGTISGTVTIAGAVTVTSGNIAVTGSVAITNASIAVTGSVTVSGAVTITSGSVTVSGAVTITSGSVTVTGAVSVSGAVTITSGSVTVSGSISISSGSVNASIVASSVTFTTDISSGYRNKMLEADAVTSGSEVLSAYAKDSVADTDLVTLTVTPTTMATHYVGLAIFTGTGVTWRLYRDGSLLASGSTTADTLIAADYQDVDVLAGTHNYTVQISASAAVAIGLYIMDEYNRSYSTTLTGTDAHNVGYKTLSTTGPTTSITLTETGTVRVYLYGSEHLATGISLVLKRDSTTLLTSGIEHGVFSSFEYEDADLAAGTYTYSTTFLYGGAPSNSWNTIALILISDGGGLEAIKITPYLMNLNVGLDTRARLQPWYQPNFAQGDSVYAGTSIAPHASTWRADYTVPTDRIAIITQMSAFMLRDAAPSAAGFATLRVLHYPDAMMTVGEISATVGVPRSDTIGQGLVMKAGEAIALYTADASTGGTYHYRTAIDYIEFDT